jgi:hypothetical protein
MTKAKVSIGTTYIVKVSGNLTRVRLTRECEYGGWYGKNLATGREIRIRTAARLRSAITPAGANRLEQIRNLRVDGMSYATASAIVNPTEF